MNPFPESLEVANYIRNHSQQDEKVAVLGSEPQIYFYSHRKSATRHLYMYPLMEKHAYARHMQAEMIREIENSRPGFIVVVNFSLSWLFQPDSPTLLRDWAQGYVDRGYEISGVVDMFSNKKTLYKWGEQAKGYVPRSAHNLLIYKRRT